ncbi:alpha/beta fold hydrolase [Microlunatus ginsengisoli]|uniref:Alpha/beta fold hydrolase n=1 Tax=Microlunatus ginsengisoli TaxID=363863 RepID=A0ABP7AXN9_9ACTN
MPGLEPQWSRFVTVRDAAGVERRWHLLDNGARGERGTMLCVHGNPTWSYLWRRFLADAPPGWRVIAVDQLGMGFSERLDRPRSLAERIDDLGRLTAELGIGGRVVTVAHDWGGPIALGWAQAHRDSVAAIVLANTGVAVPADAAAPTLIRLSRTTGLRELICVRTSLFVRGAPALSRPALPRSVRAGLRVPYRTAARRRAIGDFVADIPLEADHPSQLRLQELVCGLADLADVPVLLLWGPRDPIFGAGYLRDLLSRLPHADVQRYPGASHLVTEDRPHAAADAWRWIGDHVDGTQPAERPQPAPTAAPLGRALRDRADDPAVAMAELGGPEPGATSFRELAAKVDALAGGLSRAGVRTGDRVGLLIRPGVDLTATVYACWRLGAAVVVADAGLGVRPLAEALRSADPQWLIAIPTGLAAAATMGLPGRRIAAGSLPEPLIRAWRVEHVLTELAASSPLPESTPPDDELEAAVLFTSGATGPPKGVVYRHRQLRTQLDAVRRLCGITPDDRLVAAFAPFALYGPGLGIGAAVPDMDVTRPGTLTAAALADAAAAVNATLVFASPAALRNVAATTSRLDPQQREALARIRLVLSAGAPVSVALLRRVAAALPQADLHTPYGMTEVLPVTDISLAQIEAAGPGNGVCVGHPLPGVQLRISALDATGTASGGLSRQPGVTGEICVSAAHVKDRYDRLWAVERASSRDAGWHRTGDVGHLDENGRLWVEGRLVHVISTPDGPVTPVGVEHRIETAAGVAAAAVVGIGPVGTQQIIAVVTLQAENDPAKRGPLAEPDLAEAVRAAAAVPITAVLVTRALPVDIRHQSKIDRQRLARWANRVLAGGRPGRP